MMRFLTDRVDAFGALGQAAVELLKAESGALGGELRGSARRLLAALLLIALALFVVFWAIGALVLTAVEVAGLWLPRWAAALAVLGILLLTAAVLVQVARHRLRRIETPSATLRRRADDYQAWWERRIAGADGFAPGGDNAGESNGPGRVSASPRPDA